jgi:hypothetical protein
MMRKIYAVLGLLIVVAYAAVELNGYDFPNQKREVVAQGLRGTQSRAFHGGK